MYKNICNIFKYVYSRKTENVQILFIKVSLQKSVQNLYATIVQSGCFFMAFQGAIKYWNIMTESRPKYRFSLV